MYARIKQGLQHRRDSLMIALVCLVLSSIAIWHFQTTHADDAFITYRYARNIAAGHGFSYNPPEMVFGTTTPLYTLLLALAGVLHLPIPATSLALNALSLAALALVIYHLLVPYLPRLLGAGAALSLIILPGSYLSLGMETPLYTALVYAAFLATHQHRYRLAVLVGALATLTRYDALLVVVVVLLIEWLETRRFPWKNGVVYMLVLLPWLVAATVMFGSPLPNTLSAKAGSEQVANVFLAMLPRTFSAMIGFRSHLAVPVLLLLVALLLVAGSVRAVRMRTLWAMFIWLVLYFVAYTALQLAYVHPWYYYPPLPALLVLLSIGLHALHERAQALDSRWSGHSQPSQWIARSSSAIAGLFLALVILSGQWMMWNLVGQMQNFGGRYINYHQAGTWLCHVSRPGDTIALSEIGIIGWVCPRTIIDAYGLVTPEVLPYVHQGNRLSGVLMLQPNYIVIQNLPLDTHVPLPMHHPNLGEQYTLARSFAHVTDPDRPAVAIYQRVPTPTPSVPADAAPSSPQ